MSLEMLISSKLSLAKVATKTLCDAFFNTRHISMRLVPFVLRIIDTMVDQVGKYVNYDVQKVGETCSLNWGSWRLATSPASVAGCLLDPN
jgi:hypothetical protein